MKNPHIGNLRKRAKAFGLTITKVTTEQDAYDFGGHGYVLHSGLQNPLQMNSYSLWGIRVSIKQLEC